MLESLVFVTAVVVGVIISISVTLEILHLLCKDSESHGEYVERMKNEHK